MFCHFCGAKCINTPSFKFNKESLNTVPNKQVPLSKLEEEIFETSFKNQAQSIPLTKPENKIKQMVMIFTIIFVPSLIFIITFIFIFFDKFKKTENFMYNDSNTGGYIQYDDIINSNESEIDDFSVDSLESSSSVPENTSQSSQSSEASSLLSSETTSEPTSKDETNNSSKPDSSFESKPDNSSNSQPEIITVDSFGIFKEDENELPYQQLVAEYYQGAATKNFNLFVNTAPTCVKNYLKNKFYSNSDRNYYINYIYNRYYYIYNTKFYCKTHSITTLKDYDLINLENFLRNNFNSNVVITKGYSIKIELYSAAAIQPNKVHQFALVEINGKMSVLNTDETYF